MIRIRLGGADKASARLRAGADLDELAIAVAAAAVIRDRARQVVPVRTGQLRRSIDLSAHSDRTVIVEATAPYAAQVAFGGPTNPRPVDFMGIAVETTRGAVADAAEASVDAQLRAAGLA